MSFLIINPNLSVQFPDIMPMVLDTGVLSSLCRIQNRPTTRTSTGRVDDSNPANWTDSGLTGSGPSGEIRCGAAPISELRISSGSTEQKLADRTRQVLDRHVLLEGWYPTIIKNQRAVIDGQAWDIIGVESDSQRQMTRLEVQEYAL